MCQSGQATAVTFDCGYLKFQKKKEKKKKPHLSIFWELENLSSSGFF
jgi:hypothetical protein